MDITDPTITFNEKGVCSNCVEYEKKVKENVLFGEEGIKKLNEIAEKIKKQGLGKEYDCVLGLSGGVDSSYVAYITKKLGLRPLAVHLDNGWNSDIASSNINQIVKRLEIDLKTLVINWEEFKDLQLAYLKASVVDIEAITDHAISATLYKLANEHNIKYIISGGNVATEGIIPSIWTYNKTDLINLKDIHRKFGKHKLKTFPMLGVWKLIYYQYLKGIKTITPLNYVPYVKKDAKELLKKELGWKDYGGKHYESVFTKFYQAYILPKKFNIDKRKAHLSTLIASNQISRQEAIKEIQKPLYPDPEEFKRDKEYVLKKFGISDDEFKKIMSLPVKSHFNYKTDKWIRELLKKIVKPFRK